MSDYIQNTNFISVENDEYEKPDDLDLINESSTLNYLAEEIVNSVLQNNSDFYLENANRIGKSCRTINDIVTTFAILKKVNKVTKETGIEPPVYIVTKGSRYGSYDCNKLYYVYFFIGTFDEIKQKLTHLFEDRDNLEKTYKERTFW